jgi:hypothetical protein
MVAICSTCNNRIITSMHGRWFDPIAAVNPVTAFGKAHRCTDKALHVPAVAEPRRTVINEEGDI